MKAVILAGGLDTRISEETNLKPKAMIEIGGNQATKYQPQRLFFIVIAHNEILPELFA